MEGGGTPGWGRGGVQDPCGGWGQGDATHIPAPQGRVRVPPLLPRGRTPGGVCSGCPQRPPGSARGGCSSLCRRQRLPPNAAAAKSLLEASPGARPRARGPRSAAAAGLGQPDRGQGCSRVTVTVSPGPLRGTPPQPAALRPPARGTKTLGSLRRPPALGGVLVPPRVPGAGAAPSRGSRVLVAPILAVIPNPGWVDSGSSHVADVPPAPCSSCGDTDGGSPLATGHSCSPWVPAGGHCSVSVPPEPSPPWPTLRLLPGTSPGCPESPCSHPSCGRCWGELRAEQTPGGGGTP